MGEKGVGRFAAQKLGYHIHLVTRRKNGEELVLDIDWKKIANHHYLADVPVEIIKRSPVEFPGDEHGTLIVIEKLRETWIRGDVRKLYSSVNAMVSPFQTSDAFRVDFKLAPDKGWLDGMFDPTRAKDYALYHFEFKLDDHGFDWNYRFTPYEGLVAEKPEISAREISGTGRESIGFFQLHPPDEGQSWYSSKGRERSVSVILGSEKGDCLDSLGIGPIRGRIIAFDLDRQIRRFTDATGLSDVLKEQGGMRVYRDGMRVFDYGEPGNDWLGLDVRRVQTPTKRLSNNLFLGEIHLHLNASHNLREKTNREGFVENASFKEFKYAVMSALTAFEAERNKDQRAIRMAFKLMDGETPRDMATPDMAIDRLRREVLRVNMAAELEPYVAKVEKTWQEARDTLMNAVGSGMGLSMVFHEIERGVRGLVQALETDCDKGSVQRMAKDLASMLGDASFLVRQGGKDGLTASELVGRVINITQIRFEYHNIRITNAFKNLPAQDFPIIGSRRMLVAALSNLLDNAIHWVKVGTGRDDIHRCIWIGPGSNPEIHTIVVADGGPGFQDEPQDVVQPFFTRREDGMGLGLYYADMAMKAHGGSLAFPDIDDVEIPKACQGAVVAMVFKKEKKEKK